ncbi:MAG: T9SS type A sorting domain-containing protein, partial [Lewinella sp.]|nr:T9SS type A sorting domain-containing protein [Lewinella sp.]
DGEGFSTFGEGADGELYLAGHSSGRIYWVTEANACTPTDYTIDQSDESCAGAMDGSLAFTGNDFSVQWSTGENTAAIGSLGAGYYSATVTDVNGCAFEAFFTLSNEQPPVPPIYETNPGTLATDADSAYTYQWYLDGSPIPDTDTTAYTATASGDYQVEITNEAGCSSISEMINLEVVGTGMPLLPVTVNIHPNPSLQDFEITGRSTFSGELSWTVYNLQGQAIATGQVAPQPGFTLQLKTEDWAPGTYHLRLSDGKRQAEYPLVKL